MRDQIYAYSFHFRKCKVDAIKQTHASKSQKRDALTVLELLARQKGT